MLSADGIEAFLTPIEGDRPCGVDLRYDGACSHLFEAPKGQEHQEFVDGKQIFIVDQPDWKRIDQELGDVLGRTRDLRLWILQLRAWMVIDGLPGVARGLRLIAEGTELFWDDLHPALDKSESAPEDQALRRLNAIRALTDPTGFLKDLRRVPLVDVQGVGKYSLRDIDLANSRMSPDKDDVVHDIGRIEAAFHESDAAVLTARADLAAAVIADIDRLSKTLADRVEPGLGGVDFSALINVLELIRTLASEHARASKDADFEGATASASSPEPTIKTNGAGVPSEHDKQSKPQSAAGAGPMNGAVQNREDVIAALDRILDYYRTSEPSSPIPILLERTKRLVPKDFLGLIEDLAPTAMKQIREVGGIDAKPAEKPKPDAAPKEGAP